MTVVKIGGRRVDVLNAGCAERPCFSLFFDKGTYSQGRGYTSYHTDARGKRVERPVCGTRHLRGCPAASVCPVCRRASVDGLGARCEASEPGHSVWRRCAGITEAAHG